MSNIIKRGTIKKSDPLDTKRFSQRQVDAMLEEIASEHMITKTTLMTLLWYVVDGQGGTIEIDRKSVTPDDVKNVNMHVFDDKVLLISE